MKGVTVNVLAEFCIEQIKAGNGNKTIMISRDDEGNGFHTLFYGFITEQKIINMYAENDMLEYRNDAGKVVLLG